MRSISPGLVCSKISIIRDKSRSEPLLQASIASCKGFEYLVGKLSSRPSDSRYEVLRDFCRVIGDFPMVSTKIVKFSLGFKDERRIES